MASFTVARSILNLFHQSNQRAPRRSRVSDGTIGDADHASRDSDHNPDPVRRIVHAGDLTHDPANGCDAHALAEAIRLRCKAGDEIARVLTYIISNDRIASRRSGWEWVEYDGPNPHRAHVHFSIDHTTFAENWTGSWWAGEEIDMAAADDIIKRIGEFEQDTRKLVTGLIEKEVEEQAQKTRRVVLDLVEAIAKVQGVPPEKVRANLRPETRKILDKVD